MMLVFKRKGIDQMMRSCDYRHFIRMLNSALLVALFSATGHVGHAQEVDIQTTYAIDKAACGGGSATTVKIAEGRITGPGFDCVLSTERPVGTGLVAYEATCTVDGKSTSEGIALDLGNYSDHFELSLPGRENWLKLYPCTRVPGLK